jgi:hypothetical protein
VRPTNSAGTTAQPARHGQGPGQQLGKADQAELLKRSSGSHGRVGFRGPFEVDGPIGDAARRLATQFDLLVFTTDRARELLEPRLNQG